MFGFNTLSNSYDFELSTQLNPIILDLVFGQTYIYLSLIHS
jgi:hypothetical protein